MMKRLFPLIAALLATIGPVLADDLTGQASVIDGDTIEIHGTRIRLWGIDAPESTQLCRGEDSLQYRCGANAAKDLDAFIARRPVSCTPISQDQYGRTVATCSVDGTDLGQWLVSNGSHSTGRITPEACTIRCSERPSMPGTACGLAATWHPGCTGPASEPVEGQRIAQMTRMLTHDCCVSCWAAWASPLV
jgi:Staphylococcal nuclease homologue